MENTVYFSFSLEKPMQYLITGKFEAPSPEWTHVERWLAEDYELMVVTNGILYIADDEGEYTISAGEYLMMSPGCHQYGWQASSCSFYWLHFSGADSSILTAPPHEKPELPEDSSRRILIPKFAKLPNMDRLVILMKQMQDSIRRYNSPVQNDYLATSVLCELNCQCFNPQKSRVDMKKQQIYNDIVDYVRWYLHSDIKVQDIARHFGYNEKYLSHLFSNVAGTPLKQYILQQKLEQAKYLLSDTNDSVQKISEKLGFGDSRNFMKIFKKIVGMTPTDYRNSSSHRILNYK